MDTNPAYEQIRSNAPRGRRLTIGYLTNSLVNIGRHIWQGISDTAQAHDVNVICFSGNEIGSAAGGFDVQANVLYDLVSPEVLDGVIIYAASLGFGLGESEKLALWNRFQPLPTVLLEEVVPGFPCVTVDFRKNAYTVVSHLIQAHGYRRIAYVRGPETHSVSEMLYQGYCDALKDHDLPFDPELVALGEGWSRPGGHRGVEILFDQRRVQVEAVVGISDNVAFGIIEALQARGIRVPEDVAVAGHNDEDESPWIMSRYS
jgi:DNA-binding LacI/PurR family transcriptional regulator